MNKFFCILFLLQFNSFVMVKPLLNFLIEAKDWRNFEFIIDDGYEDINSIQDSIFKRTALHCAVNNEDLDAITRLLYKGADPNIKDFYGNTSMHLAVRNNSLEVILLLLDFKKCSLNVLNNNKATALDICDSDDIKKILKKAGAIYNKKRYSARLEKIDSLKKIFGRSKSDI